MFRTKTLFVLGAGSSCEFGLPAGKELKERISDKIDIRFDDIGRHQSGDLKIFEALTVHAKKSADIAADINKYLKYARTLIGALPLAISIDNLLDAHRNPITQLCGKLGIVKSITEAEEKSSLYFLEKMGGEFDARTSADSWLAGFTQILTESVPLEEIDGIFDNVSIINFNYDRCVEHYLENALRKYYGISGVRAREAVLKLQIIHPYGKVGRLAWQPGSAIENEFGGKANLLELADQIKTFNEQVSDRVLLGFIKSQYLGAERIVFLGFAFHPQNLELLKPHSPSQATEILATAHGISASDCKAIATDLLELSGQATAPTIDIRNDLTCSKFFSEYRRSLSS